MCFKELKKTKWGLLKIDNILNILYYIPIWQNKTCYNWRLSIKLLKESSIRLIQENLIEFLVQDKYNLGYDLYKILTYYMPSLPIWKIHPCSNTAFPTFTIQACLPWWLLFSQYVLVVMVHPSGYSVFHDRNTSIQLGFPWQSQTIVSVFTTETPNIFYIISLYIKLVVTL